MLLQQLDSLTLRDKQRFARRLHGVKKVKNPDAQQAIYQEMAKEIEQAAGKVVLRARELPTRKTCPSARRNRTFLRPYATTRW